MSKVMEGLFQNVVEISLWISVIILLLGLLRHFFGQRYGVQWRHSIWIILVLRLILPVNVSLPQPPIQLPSATESMAVIRRAMPVNETKESMPRAIKGAEAKAVAPVGREERALDKYVGRFSALSWILWSMGMGLFLLYQGGKYISFCYMLRRNRRKILDADVLDIYYSICNEKGVVKRPDLYYCQGLPSPLCMGFFRQNIYINQEDGLPAHTRLILKHELFHAQRRDVLYKGALLLVRGIHFFNPFVHWMAVMAEQDLEYVCDQEVLKESSFEERQTYGMTLLEAIRQGKQGTALSTSFNGGKKALKTRLEHVFDTERKKRGIAIFLVFALAISFGAAFIGCGRKDMSGEASIEALKGKGFTDETIRALYDARLDYIGNHIGVGKIFSLLPLGEGVSGSEKGMELFTTEEPYGAKLYLKITDEKAVTEIIDGESVYTMDKLALVNGMIFLSLVDNAEFMEYEFQEKSGVGIIFRVSREKAADYFGEKDLREFATDYETFYRFVKEVEALLPEEETTTAQLSEGELLFQEIAADLEDNFTYDDLKVHPRYEDLLKQGDSALTVILRRFDSGWGDDKEGYVMMLAAQDILGWPVPSKEVTPAEWFRMYQALDSVALKPFTYDEINAAIEKEGTLLSMQAETAEGLVTRQSEKQKAIYDALAERFNKETDSHHVQIFAPLIYKMEETEDGFSVYAVIGYDGYTLIRGTEAGYGLHHSGGSRTPARLDFAKKDGRWELTNWAEAQDGAYYTSSTLEMCGEEKELAEKLRSYDQDEMQMLMLQNLIFYLKQYQKFTVYSPGFMKEEIYQEVNQRIPYVLT